MTYIDIADGRDFVANFSSLDQEAKTKNVTLITGTSTVPGLSSAVIDAGLDQLTQLISIDYGISTGLKTGLGVATLEAVMNYCGKPYSTLRNGKDVVTYGLGRARYHDFPEPVGRRYLVDCDIPDHALFPTTYPTLQSISFGACLDVPALVGFLSFLSYCVRIGLVRNWDCLTRTIKLFVDAIRFVGDYNSGFYMKLSGLDSQGKTKRLLFEMMAREGSGLEIPVTLAMILIKRLLRGDAFAPGAYACQHLISLAEFQQELATYPISWNWRELS